MVHGKANFKTYHYQKAAKRTGPVIDPKQAKTSPKEDTPATRLGGTDPDFPADPLTPRVNLPT